MSATVVYYPDSYIELLTLLKDRVLSGRAAAFPRSNVQIGVSTNFNKICGCDLQVPLHPVLLMNPWPSMLLSVSGDMSADEVCLLLYWRSRCIPLPPACVVRHDL